MKEKLNKELLEITKLINYSRSKTLFEQRGPNYAITEQQNKGPVGPTKSIFNNPKDDSENVFRKSKDDSENVFNKPKEDSISVFEEGEMFKGWDAHDWTTVFEIGALIAGVVLTATGIGASAGIPLIGSAGSALFAASTAAGVLDAALYFKEDNEYMGSMMLALSVIPGGEFLKTAKAARGIIKNPAARKIVAELGDENAARALVKKGSKTAAEKDAVKFLADQAAAQKELVEQGVKQLGKKAVKEQVKSQSLRWILGLMKSLGKTVVLIAGVPISIDAIWLMATAPESKYRKLRDESPFGILLDLLYTKVGLKNEEGIETLKDILSDEVVDEIMNDKELQHRLDGNFENFMKDLESWEFDSEAKKLNVY